MGDVHYLACVMFGCVCGVRDGFALFVCVVLCLLVFFGFRVAPPYLDSRLLSCPTAHWTH